MAVQPSTAGVVPVHRAEKRITGRVGPVPQGDEVLDAGQLSNKGMMASCVEAGWIYKAWKAVIAELLMKNFPKGEAPTVNQAIVLAYIHLIPNVTQCDLAEYSDVEIKTLSDMLQLMVKKGWITKAASLDDMRVRVVSLTLDGKRIAGRIVAMGGPVKRKPKTEDSQ